MFLTTLAMFCALLVLVVVGFPCTPRSQARICAFENALYAAIDLALLPLLLLSVLLPWRSLGTCAGGAVREMRWGYNV